jgi:Rod binding domain-containing protein
MQIDAALMQYNNRPLRVPSGAPQVQATGARVANTSPIDRKSGLYQQCQEFESIFTKMMLKEMRNSVDKSDSLISGGWAEDIYQDQLDDKYAETMARSAGFGFADQLYRQLAEA